MVTDYSKINKFVKRPVHPFPSVADIVRSIPAGTKCFAKMDAIHGYFQLALDEESSKFQLSFSRLGGTDIYSLRWA